ncbi:MAG: hypothetical protein P8163_04080 [Candidatus Thiodiazotropha sp.]
MGYNCKLKFPGFHYATMRNSASISELFLRLSSAFTHETATRDTLGDRLGDFWPGRNVPLLADFMQRYAELDLELLLTDMRLDLFADRIDVAVRLA